MKKLLLSILVLTAFVACRQEEETISSEDLTNLKIIRNNRKLNEKNNQIIKDSLLVNQMKFDSEPLKPPK